MSVDRIRSRRPARPTSLFVMPGLRAGHPRRAAAKRPDVGGRDKPGHDDRGL